MDLSPENYLNKNVRPVLEALAEAVVTEKPDDCVGFMLDWLLNFSGQKASHQVNMEKQELQELRKELKKLKKKYTEHDKEMEVETDSENSENEDADEVDDLITINAKRLTNVGRSSVSAEVYGKYYKKENFVPKIVNKTNDQKQRLANIVNKSFVFSNLEEKDLNTVLDAMEEKKFKLGESAINEGEKGDLLYVVEKGELDCTKKNLGYLKTYVEGESFGELALLYNAPRAATITPKTDCTLWALDRETFNHIVKDSAIKKREQYESFLKSMSILKDVNPYELSQICDALKTVNFNKGETIIKENDEGDKFFILVEGEAYAEKEFKNKIEKVMNYLPGNYFGELALIKNEPRAASVIASTKCKLISLDRKSFKRLLGPIENILKRTSESYVKYIGN